MKSATVVFVFCNVNWKGISIINFQLLKIRRRTWFLRGTTDNIFDHIFTRSMTTLKMKILFSISNYLSLENLPFSSFSISQYILQMTIKRYTWWSMQRQHTPPAVPTRSIAGSKIDLDGCLLSSYSWKRVRESFWSHLRNAGVRLVLVPRSGSLTAWHLSRTGTYCDVYFISGDRNEYCNTSLEWTNRRWRSEEEINR